VDAVKTLEIIVKKSKKSRYMVAILIVNKVTGIYLLWNTSFAWPQQTRKLVISSHVGERLYRLVHVACLDLVPRCHTFHHDTPTSKAHQPETYAVLGSFGSMTRHSFYKKVWNNRRSSISRLTRCVDEEIYNAYARITWPLGLPRTHRNYRDDMLVVPSNHHG
jgi:hypothetical protein